ncbi:MAG: hypothetical protein AM325_000505 [Candidatus Thorarchaeota archaeon SMTZ1-45]|nr:MAG: hypothetical protein AM325_00520 [Candidatus Thorarchaeota archaeon SMTZ1-45]
MFTSFRYPTKKQNLIWLKRRQKIAPSVIAQELQVSRPFVSQAQRIAEQRIKKLLLNAAQVNRIKIHNVSTRYGFALGFCPANNARTFITYSPDYRVQVWFDHEGDCSNCEEETECGRILRGLAEEWNIGIPIGMPPTRIAKILFERIIERLGWGKKE